MTKLINLNNANLYKELACSEKDQGVYQYHHVDSNNNIVPVNRLLGTDEQGVLYIGSTPKRTLFERIADFRKCVLPGYNGSSHSAGRRYNGIDKLKESIPSENISVSILVTEQPKQLEAKMIEDYMQKFGEVPPLNSY